MRKRLVRLPPPLLFVLPLLLGLKLNAASALPVLPQSVAVTGRWGGWLLVAMGGALAASAVVLFARRRTTIVPHRSARLLVTHGPFRLTRNPMYVALTLGYAGVSLLADSWWPLLFLAVPLLFLQTVTIPTEEQLLREAFGAEYQDYAQRVRRWL
jgi:protein-S-isoprenylcysteine O-methyltransferase Ste14